jgi:hypothetical protein
VMTIITFDIDDIAEEDFLSRVFATVGVERDKGKLGWKTCDDKKKVPYQRLETHDDVKHAFEAHRKMLDSKQREKPVYMEVANLVCAILICALLMTDVRFEGEAKGCGEACTKGHRDSRRTRNASQGKKGLGMCNASWTTSVVLCEAGQGA